MSRGLLLVQMAVFSASMQAIFQSTFLHLASTTGFVVRASREWVISFPLRELFNCTLLDLKIAVTEVMSQRMSPVPTLVMSWAELQERNRKEQRVLPRMDIKKGLK